MKAYILFILAFSSSASQAAISVCTTPGSALEENVYITSYPKDFCDSGLGAVFLADRSARICIVASRARVQLAVGESYRMCVLAEESGVVVLAAESSRAE